jgi:hypothetical protein
MTAHRRRAGLVPSLLVAMRLASLAALALRVGVLAYAIDRQGHTAYLLPAWLTAPSGTKPVFGHIADWLPSFSHAVAFSLLTAAVLPRGTASAAGACATWCAVDGGFELAQHKAWSASIAAALPEWFARVPVLDSTGRDVRNGTFDPNDLLAIAAGCLVAYAVLINLDARTDGVVDEQTA